MGRDVSSPKKKAKPDTSRGIGRDWTRCGLTLCVLDLEADAVVQMGIRKYRYEHLEMPDWGDSLGTPFPRAGNSAVPLRKVGMVYWHVLPIAAWCDPYTSRMKQKKGKRQRENKLWFPGPCVTSRLNSAGRGSFGHRHRYENILSPHHPSLLRIYCPLQSFAFFDLICSRRARSSA